MVTLGKGIGVSFPRQIPSTYTMTPGIALKDTLLVSQIREEKLR
jgi:hypothetical protein